MSDCDWSDDDGFADVIAKESITNLKSSLIVPPAAPCSVQPVSETVTSYTAPEEFPFPFTPYDIQNQLMSKIYEALQFGKIGIFESPTGTGKSMSMICGALKWLVDYEKQKEEELKQLLDTMDKEERIKRSASVKVTCNSSLATASSAEQKKALPDWITNYEDKRAEKERLENIRREREALLKKENKLLELKQNLQAPLSAKYQNKRKRDQSEDTLGDTFSDLLAGADDDIRDKYQKEAELIGDDFLLNQLADTEKECDEDTQRQGEQEEDDVYVTKIYFCSRTHSQLSQFVGEVKKSPYADKIRTVAIGSRQNMCINPTVTSLKSLSLINDRCKELQKSSGSSKKVDTTGSKRRRSAASSCPYYNQTRIRHLTDRALLQVMDIEDLVETGKKVKACPYYAARHAIPAAQLVVLPYNTLLHDSTRRASGIKLQGNIVVIDEAHNLLETISNIHSVQVHLSQFTQCKSQLKQYRDKYKSRLLPVNLLNVNQLIDVISQIIVQLNTPPRQSTSGGTGAPDPGGGSSSQLMTVNNFLTITEIDNINFFSLLRFCEKSLIARKLSGFVEKMHKESQNAEAAANQEEIKPRKGVSGLIEKIKQQSEKVTSTGSASTASEKTEADTSGGREKTVAHMNSPLYIIESLLQALTNSDSDGRVIINRPASSDNSSTEPSMRYLLLNPAIYFSRIVQECRAVVIAGGTMQPVSEFKDQLFHMSASDVSEDKMLEFSCGHVIPKKNLLPIALSHDSKGRKLEFTYQSRNLPSTLESLSTVLIEICECVPGGVVCFLPSYQYEAVVMNHLNKSGAYQTINSHKKIFREPKKANQVDTVLEAYCRSIKSSGGAFLFSVVGGKMSEGINFSDDLGRCVIMVGLPYPNMYSPELKEKMNYLNINMKSGPDGVSPGQVHYENLCMKAVNQSIGRAIRHRGDYSCMLLLDHRYQKDSIISKLPGWLRDHVSKITSSTHAVTFIQKFFASHQS